MAYGCALQWEGNKKSRAKKVRMPTSRETYSATSPILTEWAARVNLPFHLHMRLLTGISASIAPDPVHTASQGFATPHGKSRNRSRAGTALRIAMMPCPVTRPRPNAPAPTPCHCDDMYTFEPAPPRNGHDPRLAKGNTEPAYFFAKGGTHAKGSLPDSTHHLILTC